MKFPFWESGRQRSGYDKMLLATGLWPVPFDLYILRFRAGSVVPSHTDPVLEGENHYRLNIIVKHAKSGGEFWCTETIIDTPRIKFFRPDLHFHGVTRVYKGTRYVISFGFIRRSK